MRQKKGNTESSYNIPQFLAEKVISLQIEVTLIRNLPLNIVKFCAGNHYSLFLDSEGNVFAVGKNSNGNLGLGHNTNQNVLNQVPNIPPIRSISCVGDSSYPIDVDENLWSFGDNTEGQLGHGDKRSRNVPTKIESLKNITQTVQGYGCHFLAKDSQNKIFACGRNKDGRLGTGNLNRVSSPVEIDSQYSQIWGECQVICRAISARK